MEPRGTERAPAPSAEVSAEVDARTSLALWLRQARTVRKLSLDDVSRITKIQTRILERIESGRFEGLPAQVFVRGFVRSFARCVGLNELEAVERFGACAAGEAPPVANAKAKAFVETMSLQMHESAAAGMTARPSRIEVVDVIRPVEIAPVIEVAPGEIAAPEEIPVSVVSEGIASSTGDSGPAVATATATEPAPKKKRASRKKTATADLAPANAAAAPAKRRKRKASESSESPVIDAAPALPSTSASVDATELTEATAVAEAAVIEASVAEAAAIGAHEPASETSTFEATPSEAVAVAADSTATEHVPHKPESTGTWLPTMPAMQTTPTPPIVPWRRPSSLAIAAPIAPSLIIDDADPDQAERLQDLRNAEKDQRVSFLPPILLDREDRSRQGGLTLAVIILLIAATLTLSYLMRRPSANGDGVTMADSPASLIIAS